MSLSDFSIKNRVFAVMLSAAMVIFGYLGYRDLGVSQFPEIDFPVVNVTTLWEGAAPETMDLDVTDKIEDAVADVEGIDYVQSSSLQGQSVVTVFFHLHRDIDVAMQDVQNAVSGAGQRLPPDIDPPIISKLNFNKFPVIWLSVHGHRPTAEVSRFVDDHLKQQIESIPGCGGVMYGGLRRRSMRVWLDGAAMQSFGLDAADVADALRREHVEMPAGYLQGARREINVRTMGEATTPEQFRAIPIGHKNGALIRLGDIAVVEDGLEDRRGFARFNREPTVGIGVLRATGANVVQVCQQVKDRLPMLRKMLPPDMEISISTDYSLFIQDDIAEVKEALFFGIVLTALVTYLFLGSMGTTLNVCVSIPTSLIGTFIAMRWFGFTVNFMTLLALSLSVGVVVDDAILVLENIYRRREHGEVKREAALRGAREISFAALAATLSIVAIFIPVAFMRGAIGKFFFQFGIAVTVAVLLSLVVALTITPMLCSVFLQVRHMRRPMPQALRGPLGWPATAIKRLYWFVDRWVLEPILLAPVNWVMDQLTRGYERLVPVFLRHQWYVVAGSAGLAGLALVFAFGLDLHVPVPAFVSAKGEWRIRAKPVGRELVPSEDQNRFIINIICPVGTSIDYIDEMLHKAEDVAAAVRDPVTGDEVFATFFSAVGLRPGGLVSEGVLFCRLKAKDERSWTQSEVMNEMRQRLAVIPGMRAIVLDLSTQGFTASRGYPVNFAVQGPDWDKVTELSERIRERLTGSSMVADVNSDYRPGMPEVRIRPEKAAELGVSVRRLAWVLNVSFGGVRNGRFTDRDRRYDVRLRYLDARRDSPDQLDQVYVKNDHGKLVPVSDVTSRETVSTLPVINRYNHLRKVELTANMGPGVVQGEAVAYCQQVAEEVREEMELPPGYRIVQLGNAQAMQTTLDSLWWALSLGFLVAYMILGVQFNSFVHPFTVLLAVPFAVTGALAMLWWFGDTLNMMSMIGLVLLAGLVKKNSIILVDYINHLRTEGVGLEEAVKTACPVRLRPILMTSVATIASALPLAFGFGPGAETRAPLARSIIGGIILSTMVTLVIVPVFYVLLDRLGRWVHEQARREENEPERVEKQVDRILEMATNGTGARERPAETKIAIRMRGTRLILQIPDP